VVNALFYLRSNGIKWRAMPPDRPRWQSVDTDFRAWERDGTWHQLNAALRTQLRLQAGRNAHPRAGSVDRQAVKTASGGEASSLDGGKQVKGRKRTILVDTMGLLLAACVPGAGRSDQRGMTLLATFHAQFWLCLPLIWVDSTFAGKAFIAHIQQPFGWTLAHLKRTDNEPGFTVLPQRWVVERTYAWFGHYRRLSKDDEFLATTSEVMLYAAMVHLMVRRLKPKTHAG
jgi:putative transposase